MSRPRERTHSRGLLMLVRLAHRKRHGVAGFPLALVLAHAALPKRSWVKISQIKTLSVERIGSKLGSIAPQELNQIVDGLNEIVGS